jgi:hypothetical protein
MGISDADLGTFRREVPPIKGLAIDAACRAVRCLLVGQVRNRPRTGDLLVEALLPDVPDHGLAGKLLTDGAHTRCWCSVPRPDAGAGSSVNA